MWAIEAMQVAPGAPDTHDDSHQRSRVGACGTTFCAEKPF